MDELFETVTLIQAGKIKELYIVVFGLDYWTKLRGMLEVMVKEKTISEGDMDLILFTNSMEEATKQVERITRQKFGLIKKPKAIVDFRRVLTAHYLS